MGHNAFVLWTLGFPEQAKKLAAQAVSVARDHGSKLEIGIALFQACSVMALYGDVAAVTTLSEELQDLLQDLSTTHIYQSVNAFWQAWTTFTIASGRENAAILEKSTAKANDDSTLYLPLYTAHLAEAWITAGDCQRALKHVNDALALSNATGRPFWDAELYRLKGECLLALAGRSSADDSMEAESYLAKARAIAQDQAALSLELRATVSIARQWEQTGRRSQAHVMLSATLNRFTEGSSAADLTRAMTTLDNLR